MNNLSDLACKKLTCQALANKMSWEYPSCEEYNLDETFWYQWHFLFDCRVSESVSPCCVHFHLGTNKSSLKEKPSD